MAAGKRLLILSGIKMERKILPVLLCFLFSLTAGAQKRLTGVVLDAEKNLPLPKASVFLNNTSIGVTANEEGRFELFIPAGKYELIVSSVGYNTSNQTVTATDVQDFLTIKLAVKAPELEAIVIEPYEKDGWQKWGNFFLENFIGTSALGADCKILNKDLIRFRHSRKNNRLTAHAPEPLLIENKALGYRIRFQLELFQFDFTNRLVLYIGYPFFEPLTGKAKKQREWEARRQDVYAGSIMHFMRSVYRNTLAEEGFEVRRLKKIPNTEKQRVREMIRQQADNAAIADNKIAVGGSRNDSSDYYNDVLSQPDSRDLIGRDVLPGDSIAFAIDSVTAGLQFPHFLYIHYKNGKAPSEYKRRFPGGGDAMISQFFLQDDATIAIQANGMYYNPVDLITSGYWGWREKMATMLPFDYKPKE